MWFSKCLQIITSAWRIHLPLRADEHHSCQGTDFWHRWWVHPSTCLAGAWGTCRTHRRPRYSWTSRNSYTSVSLSTCNKKLRSVLRNQLSTIKIDDWLNVNDQVSAMFYNQIGKTVLILTPAAGICPPCRRILPEVPLCRRTPCTPGRTMSQWPSGSSGVLWADRGTCCPVCPSDRMSTSDLGTRETLGNTEPKPSCRHTSKPKKMRISFTFIIMFVNWSDCNSMKTAETYGNKAKKSAKQTAAVRCYHCKSRDYKIIAVE